MANWQPVRVTIETGDAELDSSGQFDAFTTGETWNGWATPHFSQEQAQRVAEWSQQLRSKLGPEAADIVRWDPALEGFIIESADDTGDDHPASRDDEAIYGLFVKEVGETLFPIGAWRWTWEIVQQ